MTTESSTVAPTGTVWDRLKLPKPLTYDPHALVGYVIEHDAQMWAMREALEEALGEADGRRTADTVEELVFHARKLDELRAELRRRLPELAGQISEVAELLEELRSDQVFDEEYLSFEGNQMAAALADAVRQVRLAERVNPFRERPAETSRRKVLREEATISHAKRSGYVGLDSRLDIDVAALADLVAAGLGTFHNDDTLPDPYPRIAGVVLNEAGYAAAVAAGAQEPF